MFTLKTADSNGAVLFLERRICWMDVYILNPKWPDRVAEGFCDLGGVGVTLIKCIRDREVAAGIVPSFNYILTFAILNDVTTYFTGRDKD